MNPKLFTANQKQATYRNRKEIKHLLGSGTRPGGAGAGKGGDAGASNCTIKVLTSSIEALTSKLTNAKDTSDDEDDEGSNRMPSDVSAGSKRSNHGHPALCRPGKKQK